MSIFVGNLPFRAEREDVLQLFASFGEVLNCSLPLERDTGRKRGFAFVEMADEDLDHQPIAVDGEDCICLAVTDAPLKFQTLVHKLVQPFLKI